MKLTITNDDGEVFVIATDIHRDDRIGKYVATDNEGYEVTVDSLLREGLYWATGS